MSKEKRIFFKGLNELRALAAFGVIIHHIEQIKRIDRTPSVSSHFEYLVHNLGKASVNLFFVLSGFLITYLLFQEKRKNSKVDIKKFYLRRIFRIWPLYYLIMILGLIVIPLLPNMPIYQYSEGLVDFINTSENYSLKNITLYLTFLPQFARPIAGIAQSWSIGVEEQFYLVIPLILAILTRKKIFKILGLIIIVYLISTLVMYEYYHVEGFIYKVYKYFKIQFLTIGAIGGYLYFFYTDVIARRTQSKFLYASIVIVLVYLMIFKVFSGKLQEFILGLGFMLLILFTINDANKLTFRNSLFSYFGKISYGIYMYHPFIIFLMIPIINKYFYNPEGPHIYYNVLLYLSCFLFTIVLSTLSFKLFESKFIKIKDKKYRPN